ncbi:MAG: TonB-dependent receptor [Caulobacteraceae bacterium]
MHRSLLLGVSLIGLYGGVQSVHAATANTGSAATVQEIVVTAEKRSENIQTVPVDVTAVSDKELLQRGIETTSQLVLAVPSLTVSSAGVFQIRGLGTQGFGRSAEQSVSVVVDGVSMPRPLANVLGNSVFDLNHVEVLNGPQGTLFGRNADSGVINIVSNAPVLGQYEAIVHADVGTHDFTNIDGIVNIPLGQNAALRLAVHHDTTGHIVYNTVYGLWDHEEDDGLRGRFLWKPRDNLTVNLSADYQDLSSNGVNGGADFAGVSVFTSIPAGTPLATTIAGCGIVPGPNNNKTCASSLYAQGVSTGDVYGGRRGGGAVQIDWNFWGGLTLTSITALRQSVTGDFAVFGDIAGDFGDSLPASVNVLKRNLVPTYLRQFSEEARIASPAADRINWVAGVYYSDTATVDRIDQSGQLGIPLGPDELRRLNTIWGHATNYAGFGQINFELTPQLTLIAGGRVTHDDLSDFSFNSFPDAVPAGPFIYTANTGAFSVFPVNSCTLAGGNPDVAGSCPAGTSLAAPAKLSTTGYNWKAGIKYTFSHELMVFATATHGYKGPFVNDQASYPIAGSQLVVKPESALAFEIGLKSTLWDRLAVDLDIFDQKTDNFQTTIYVPIIPPALAPNFIQGNAPYAITRGVELSVFGNVTRDFSLDADLLYDDAHFGPNFTVNCATGPCLTVSQMPFAPTWKATLRGEYRHKLSDKVQGYVESDLTFSSKFPYVSNPGPGNSSGSRYMLGAHAGFRFDHDRYAISVFCRNCLDERYPASVGPYLFASEAGGVSPAGVDAVTQYLSIDSYRVVGVTLDAKW